MIFLSSSIDNKVKKMKASCQNILVIKHGALGDFIYVLGAMKAIRDFHPDAYITLLTTKPYADLGKRCGYFDEVMIDRKPSWRKIFEWTTFYKWIRQKAFERVYDLQNSTRTQCYFTLFFSSGTLWSADFKQAAFPYLNPLRNTLHPTLRKRQQLTLAGIPHVPDPDISWLGEPVHPLPHHSFLLIPGSSVRGQFKRWPAAFYGIIARKLIHMKRIPVIVGTYAEEKEAALIQEMCPQTLNLCGKTTLGQLTNLARQAEGALGNDTGPLHLISIAGCPVVGLFSGKSNPSTYGPYAKNAVLKQHEPLEKLSVESVWEEILKLSLFDR